VSLVYAACIFEPVMQPVFSSAIHFSSDSMLSACCQTDSMLSVSLLSENMLIID